MSQSLSPLEVVKVIVPECKINSKRQYAVLKGGAENNYKKFVSSSFSNNSCSFSCPPPNPSIIVDRRVWLKYKVRLSFTGTGATAVDLVLQNGKDALRAFPLTSILNTLSVSINNTTVSVNASDILPALMRANVFPELKRKEYSTFPSYQDHSQKYSDLVGTNKNPLGTFGLVDESGVDTRGSYEITFVTPNVQTGTTVIDVEICEPIFLSPFLFNGKDKSGFCQVQTLDFTFNWNTNLERIWSRSDVHSNTLSALVVNLAQYPPELLFHYITPSADMVIPQVLTYPYQDIQRYITQVGTINAGQLQSQISTNNIQLSSVPKKLYIYAKRRVSTETAYTTDTFGAIEQMSVSYNNRSGLLAQASQYDLYQLSRKNGLEMSWNDFHGLAMVSNSATNGFTKIGSVGSVVIIDPCRDLGLSPVEASGINETIQLQINLNVRNVNQTDAVVFDVYVVAVNEGVFTIANQRTVSQIGVLSRNDVLNASSAPEISYHRYVNELEGGSFMDDLRMVLDSPWENLIKPVGKAVLPLAVPLARKLIGIGESSGGMEEEEMEQMEMDGDAMRKMKKGKAMRSAGVLVGSGKMSRSELKKRLNM
jgi:hypothetical protein